MAHIEASKYVLGEVINLAHPDRGTVSATVQNRVQMPEHDNEFFYHLLEYPQQWFAETFLRKAPWYYSPVLKSIRGDK